MKLLTKRWLRGALIGFAMVILIGFGVFVWWSLQPRQIITGYNNIGTQHLLRLKLGGGKNAASLYVRYAGDGRLILTYGPILEDHSYQLCGVRCGEEKVHIYASQYIFVTMNEDGTINVRWESPIKYESLDPL